MKLKIYVINLSLVFTIFQFILVYSINNQPFIVSIDQSESILIDNQLELLEDGDTVFSRDHHEFTNLAHSTQHRFYKSVLKKIFAFLTEVFYGANYLNTLDNF